MTRTEKINKLAQNNTNIYHSSKDKLKESFLSAIYETFNIKNNNTNPEISNKKEKGLTKEKITQYILGVDLHAQIIYEQSHKKFNYFLQSKSGLPQFFSIRNAGALQEFSQIHGFFPIIEKVYIDNCDISEVIDFIPLYKFLCYLAQYGSSFSLPLYNEIKKITNKIKLLQESAYDINDIEEIAKIIQGFCMLADEHVTVFGHKSQRNQVLGAIPEKIYLEIAATLENGIRDLLNMESTYMKLDSYDNDTNGAIDIDRIVSHEVGQYDRIPLQITTGDLFTAKEHKSDAIGHNAKRGHPFFITSIRGRFAAITHNGKMANDYKKRRNNPSQRALQHNKSFPYFSHTLRANQTDPIKSNYIMCHIVYNAIHQIEYVDSIIPSIESLLQTPSRIDTIILRDLAIKHWSLSSIPSSRVYKLSLSYTHKGKDEGQIIVYF